MKKLIIVSLLLPFVMLYSCTGGKVKQIENIKALESQILDTNTGMVDKSKSLALMGAMEDFVKKFPKDTNSPRFLFKVAELQMHTMSPQQAITTFDRIIKEYPDYKKTSECLFMKGFVYENNLADLNNARSCYEEFINKYPSHYFADDAKILLTNLGKSPEELIREFEQKNAEVVAEPGK